MGKAARLKKERRLAAAQPAAQTPAIPQRTIVLATAGLVIVAGVAVGILLATRSSPKAPPPVATPPADKNAPAALVAAADKVGFHPNVEPGVGQLEGEPASAARPPSNPNLLAVGSKAPTFTLRTSEGKRVSLAGYRGKAVLLEFFATWCPHCDAEAPHLRDLFASLPRSRYAWVAVNADGEDAASVYAYDRYFGLASPTLLDPSSQPGSFHKQGAAGPVTTRYQVQAYPTMYVLDRTGRITWRSDGEQPDALLLHELRSAAVA
jgi:peroxiredoxin